MARTPLLEIVSGYLKKSLENVVLIGCQHFLEGNLELIVQMQKMGLQSKNTYLIGKSYSFNDEIANELEISGVNVHRYSFDSHIEFDSQFHEEVEKYLKQIHKTINLDNSQDVICIDDGGQLISTASRLGLTQLVGVEQTSSGYHLLRDYVVFPVVNVARSDAKLLFETPYIVDCFMKNLTKYLESLSLSPNNCLIVGGGPIGKAILNRINIPADLFDSDKNKNCINETDLSKIVSNYDLIVGATGNTSLPSKYHTLLKHGTVLASVSSSDREFDAATLRRTQSHNNDPHRNYVINGVYLPNSGFPLTFDGGRTAVPTQHIQLTHALMLAGIFQALDNPEHGINELSGEIQKMIVKEFQAISAAS